jgi:hypothetical protein
LQPAQVEAVQEEQPEDMDLVVPSLERETPLKHEKSCSTSFDWQSGQWIPFPEDAPNTSFSNSVSHFRHLYSKIGMTTSNHISFYKAMVPQASGFSR